MKLAERLKNNASAMQSRQDPPQHEWPVSINIITTEADFEKTVRLFPSIPKGCEVVVVFSKQTDGETSEEVERKTTEKSEMVIVRRTFNGNFHFADARNAAKRHSTRKWIMWLDSDDQIVSTNCEILFEELETVVPDGIGGIFCGCVGLQKGVPNTSPSYYSIAHLRLFRNHPKIWWSGETHEQIADAVSNQKYTIMYSDLIVQHHGYNCEEVDLENKLRRNVTGMAKELSSGIKDDVRRKGVEDLLYRDLSSLISFRS